MTTTKTSIETKQRLVIDDWNLLRSFIAIYETGTLTEAANQLNMTLPSMGRHLRELEALTKETLFIRLPGKLKPSQKAEALFESMLPLRQSVRAAEDLLASTDTVVEGVVRIAAAEAYAYHVIPDILTPLLREHPELEIELSVSNQNDNLLRRDADIAVRFARPTQGDLVATKVGETSLGMFAHEYYIQRHGERQDVNACASHIMAGDDRYALPKSGVVQGQPVKEPVRFRFRTDFALAREASLTSGNTMSMMFVDVAKTMPQLKRVMPEQLELKLEVWLCAHDELRRSSRMRLIWERLEASLRARLSP